MPESDSWLEIAVELAGIDAETAADGFRPACPGGVALEPAHRPPPPPDAHTPLGAGHGAAAVAAALAARPPSARAVLARLLEAPLRPAADRPLNRREAFLGALRAE